MKSIKLSFAGIWVTAFLLFSGCSELNDPVSRNRGLAVHPQGITDVGSTNFHGKIIRDLYWDIRECRGCHGVDYSGGIANATCNTCHEQTPEDCTVCHGEESRPSGEPPVDLAGNDSPDARGVGLHMLHVNGGAFSDGVDCQSCHIVPDSLFAAGHLDGQLPAEVTFSGLAVVSSAMPSRSPDGLSCSDSYCHGNWSLAQSASARANAYTAETMTGSNAVVTWTSQSSEECGICHGLPPNGHLDVTINQCTLCHLGVVDGDGQIIDRSKHINGRVNVYGEEYPMF